MKKSIRPIGIHVRLYSGLSDVIQAVEQLNVSIAQSFLMTESNAYVSLTDNVRDNFIRSKKKLGFLYFVHAAYWSGITDKKSKMFISLQKEVEVAQSLQSNGIIVHPGASKAGIAKRDQLAYVAECVNELHRLYPEIKIILENGPHAGRCFGGDLESFALLLERIDKKDLIGFCFDTAHAFVYGYDLVRDVTRKDVMHIFAEGIGQEYITLLHFNDSKDRCGSYIDKHEVPGDGLIGKKSLQLIMNDPLFKEVPIIMELSGDSEKAEKEVIQLVASWES